MRSATPVVSTLLILLLTACQSRPTEAPRNSAYFWSTRFVIDSAQQQFISEQHISRIYLRFFDVVVDGKGQVMPNATVHMESNRPDGVEIVPTVFIMNNCLEQPHHDLDSLLLQRVMQMCETHDIDSVGEIQLDCDWTSRTREAYFTLLEKLRQRASKRGLRLSATIRLHQLAEAPPPVDRGILMMYNTGEVKDRDHNPILEMESVIPYLRQLSHYSLPLSTAYPAFGWDLLFRGSRFIGIVHYEGEWPVLPDDTVIHRYVPLSTLEEVHTAVDTRLPSANNEVILFDISPNNIKLIRQHHYEKIYHH